MGTFNFQEFALLGVRLGSLQGAVARGFAAWQHERAVRATCAALERLDNAQLRDLGIYRSEIQSVAIRTAGERPYERSARIGVTEIASVAILALILAMGLVLVFGR